MRTRKPLAPKEYDRAARQTAIPPVSERLLSHPVEPIVSEEGCVPCEVENEGVGEQVLCNVEGKALA